MRNLNTWIAIAAFLAISVSLWNLHTATSGISVTKVAIDTLPATVFAPVDAKPGPSVVIAHGFAGSQQLMQSFAVSLACSGYVAVTFDFAGHGRNPAPLTGSIVEADGATRTLVGEVARVAQFARGLGDGRLAVLGHSMASDIVVRFAEETPDIGATVAVSMFSPVVTATAPKNLLVIVGNLESGLKAEALRVVGLATAPQAAVEGVTYGDFADGTARRAAFSAGVEHIGVLYSRTSMVEAVRWLDGAFAIVRASDPAVDRRGPWIMVLFLGVVALARPLSSLLPIASKVPAGASLSWRLMWVPLVPPAIATPLLLRVLPTHFLPVLVGDYLAAHFAVYGVLTALCLFWVRGRNPAMKRSPVSIVALATGVAATLVFTIVAMFWPIDTYVTSFVAGKGRVMLVLAMMVGTLSYFLADEWMTRGYGAACGAYAASKVAFLLSLATAVGLDFERLFFLIIIVPVMVVFFTVYGLFSGWIYRRTGHPFSAGIANAISLAWAIGVTFPLLAS